MDHVNQSGECRSSKKRSDHQQRSYTLDTKFWRDPGVANFKVRGAKYLKVWLLSCIIADPAAGTFKACC